jgi:hypothetical protein
MNRHPKLGIGVGASARSQYLADMELRDPACHHQGTTAYSGIVGVERLIKMERIKNGGDYHGRT